MVLWYCTAILQSEAGGIRKATVAINNEQNSQGYENQTVRRGKINNDWLPPTPRSPQKQADRQVSQLFCQNMCLVHLLYVIRLMRNRNLPLLAIATVLPALFSRFFGRLCQKVRLLRKIFWSVRKKNTFSGIVVQTETTFLKIVFPVRTCLPCKGKIRKSKVFNIFFLEMH